MGVKEQIMESHIVAIARGVPSARIVEIGEALLAGGINCIEVTFDQTGSEGIQNTLEAIHALSEALGDKVLVGAGTVLTAAQVSQAHSAGAGYIISPDVNPEVIYAAKQLGLCSIPGAMTPTEVVRAYDQGADMVKLFPVSSLGVGYIKALRVPLAHIPMLAVGGVTPENAASFLEAGVCGVGVGGNLVSAKALTEGGPEAITALARRFTDALKRGN